ncbi:MAG TPA: Lrp/AsnC family transcriptional regulator [Streptosporangiaceae bacterium]|nr:Lrp/AsnC family transcriptional regulator [Streptosporangiaceae bacterium]
MDAIDRKILAELQTAGRLTVTELAQRVALSVAPCHRRLRELERSGAIRGYRAVIDPAAVGLGFEVLVQVTMAARTPRRSPSSSAAWRASRRYATPSGCSATPTT